MKHILRTQNRQGFGLPDAQPHTLAITHVGSGQQFTQPLQWRRTPTGGLGRREHLRAAARGQAGRLQRRAARR